MAVRLLLVLAVLGWQLWSGYQRRRATWTARSWRRFVILLAVAVTGAAIGLAMGVGVDRGVYDGMAPALRRIYFYTLMTLAIGGQLGTVGLVLWFGQGRPERQLG